MALLPRQTGRDAPAEEGRDLAREQSAALPPEVRAALEAEIIRQEEEESATGGSLEQTLKGRAEGQVPSAQDESVTPNRGGGLFTRRNVGRALTLAGTAAEGLSLGLAGQPLSNLSILKRPPDTTERDLEIFEKKERIKAKIKSEFKGDTSAFDKLLEGLGGGDLPPGTSLSVKGPGGASITTPLTQKFTGEEQRIIGGAEQVSQDIDIAIGLVDQVSNLFDQVRADIGSPILVRGELEKFQSALNKLKARIPFAKGGKQLTPFESKLLFRLLETQGKEKETIESDLRQFKIEFNKLSELAVRGGAALDKTRQTKEEDLSQLSDEELQRIINE